MKEDCFDEKIIIKNDIDPVRNKVKYLYESPYEYTLFIDTDTQIIKPIYEIFDLLKSHDLAIANVPQIVRRYYPAKLISYVEVNPYNLYNTGVILFKKNQSNEKFFSKWLEEVMLNDPSVTDQYYFCKLIHEKYHVECGINFMLFPNKIYNVRPPMVLPLKKSGEWNNVKIVHCHNLHRSLLMRQYIKILKRISREPVYKTIRKFFVASK